MNLLVIIVVVLAAFLTGCAARRPTRIAKRSIPKSCIVGAVVGSKCKDNQLSDGRAVVVCDQVVIEADCVKVGN